MARKNLNDVKIDDELFDNTLIDVSENNTRQKNNQNSSVIHIEVIESEDNIQKKGAISHFKEDNTNIDVVTIDELKTPLGTHTTKENPIIDFNESNSNTEKIRDETFVNKSSSSYSKSKKKEIIKSGKEKGSKKAKHVEIDVNKIYSYQEWRKLWEHAYNSSLWGINNYRYHSHRIREKLLSKGYLDEEIYYINHDDVKRKSNIIGEVIHKLEEDGFLNDYEFCKSLAESKFFQGKGNSMVRAALLQKGYDRDTIDTVMEELLDNDFIIKEKERALKRTYQQIIRSTTYRNKLRDNKWKANQYLYQSLMRKGYTYSEIDNVISDLSEK